MHVTACYAAARAACYTLLDRGYGHRTGAMQGPGYGLPRTRLLGTSVNSAMIQALSVYVQCGMQGRGKPSKLPEGYRLDLSSDPDAPVLRRPDGTAAARFSAWGMTKEAIEQEALEDFLHRSEVSRAWGPMLGPQST